MAIVAYHHDVTDTAAEVDVTPARSGFSEEMLLKNSGASSAFLGGSDVDDTDGFELEAGASIALPRVGENDVPWAVCSTGESTTLEVLEVGR